MKTIEAIGKHLVLRPLTGRTKTASGLFLPKTDEDGRPLISGNLGRVVSIGPDVTGFKIGEVLVTSKPMKTQPDGVDSEALIITNVDNVVGRIVDMTDEEEAALKAYKTAIEAGLSEDEAAQCHTPSAA